MLTYMSTESLLNSFPMFGHPGISALEYAGQMEEKRKLSLCISDVSLKRKSTTSVQDENDGTAGNVVGESGVAVTDTASSPMVPVLEELGSQQRRRGTFINHTPRDHEVRSSKPIEVYRPLRTESENFSRPLSRHGSMASNSPTLKNYQQYCEALAPNAMEQHVCGSQVHPSESESEEPDPAPILDVYVPSSKPQRRSVSAPLGKLEMEPTVISATEFILRDAGYRSASSASHKPQDKKRQRRQTPWKFSPTEPSNPRHAPLEPWVAEHRRKRTSETIGDVPFDMEREVSAEIGTFGVIQRYFDSQGGGPVPSPITAERALGSNPPDMSPNLDTKQTLQEAIAMYPIDETEMSDEPPPVPDRSPKRLTNPAFPSNVTSILSTDTEFRFATEGQYSPYEKNDDSLQVKKKRTTKRPSVGEAARAGSSNIGKMAPAILGHQALTASSSLGLNDLSYWLKHTGPSPPPPSANKQQKRNGINLFKAKPRKTLAARVGSVEGSPDRPRRQPAIPSCAKEMTTSAGSKHLKIIIPTETPRVSQALALPIVKARGSSRSRHVSITFTEEMLNPLGSPEVERIISSYETRERSASEPPMKSPRGSPKRTPKKSTSVPVTEHPLATSRDQLTRARKLRDLQRVKRKPVPDHAASEQNQQQHVDSGAPLTPAHTPEPVNVTSSPLASMHEDSGIDEESPKDKMDRLQDRVVALQRQNAQLTEALAKIVGLELGDGEGGCEEVLMALTRVGVTAASGNA